MIIVLIKNILKIIQYVIFYKKQVKWPADISFVGVEISQNAKIDKYVSINRNTCISGYHNYHVEIGKFCSIGPSCFLIVANHIIEGLSTSSLLIDKLGLEKKCAERKLCKGGNIIIGNDVWISAYVTILPNVKIGDGAVIGANSIVTKDIPPYAIAVGNPAKVIRYRFSNKIINKLLQIQWWNWDFKKIKNNRDAFMKTGTHLEKLLNIF